MQSDAACSDQDWGKFGFSLTPSLLQLFEQVSNCPHAPQELQDACNAFKSKLEATVPWKLVHQASLCLQQQQQQQPPAAVSDQQQQRQVPLADICAGSKLILPSPAHRQRSEQLQQRLAKLQESVDAQRYAAMVADVTLDEQEAAAVRGDPFFPTTKLQLSFGLHVIVTMGTFFALGYYGGLFVLHSQTWAALCGCLGLMGGLLLETTLLILRINSPAPLDQKYADLLDKRWDQKQPEKGTQQTGAAAMSQRQSKAAAAAAGGGVSQQVQRADGDDGSSVSKQQLRRRRPA